MKRSALALFLSSILPVSLAIYVGCGPCGTVAFANSDNSSSNSSSLLNNIFGGGHIVGAGGASGSSTSGAGGSATSGNGSGGGHSSGKTGKTNRSTHGTVGNGGGASNTATGSQSTNMLAQQVVESDYETTLSGWMKAGVRDARSFAAVIHPRDFRVPGGHAPVVSKDRTHGYDEPAFQWNDNIPYVEFSVNVPESGLYQIRMDYYSASGSLVPIERGILINGKYEFFESRRTVLPGLWRDASGKFPTDEMGNEMPPDQVGVPAWQSQYVADNTYLNDQPLRFYLKQGMNVIRLDYVSQSVMLGRVTVESPQTLATYQEYLQKNQGAQSSPSILYAIEAEHPTLKSDPSIRAMPSADPSVTPQRSGLITLNTFGDTSWQNGGQSVTWTLHVGQDGYYHLAFKYQQSEQINLPVYRTLEIDGTVPFQQMLRIPFEYTTSWKNEILSDSHGTPYQFYLGKGEHRLTLIADPAPYAPIISTVQQVMRGLDNLSLEIKMVTGNTQDQNRDWNVTSMFPHISDQLNGYAGQLLGAYHQLEALSGTSPDQAQSLVIAADRLKNLADEPDTIPYRFNDLAQGQGSINDSLGNILASLPNQPLLLDKIYVYGNGVHLPSPTASFLRVLEAYVMSFFQSFTRDYSHVGESSRGALTVWVNRPREYVMLMQELADEDFTRRTGIKVSMMLMPDEQKLVLANAAGQTPDVALGLNNSTPFNLGIRGAVLDLSQFPDFKQVTERFSAGAMLPFMFNNHDYAIPETQNFWVLFYRKDILQALHIPVPQTWNQVISILPQLQRYGMNFYDPIAGVGGYKYFYTTVPFLYQSGAQLFNQNGMGTAIDSENALNGFKLMTQLFTVYGLPLQVPNFYSHFRQGDLPIGISDFNTYIQLTAAAPELNGLWGIAPLPGIKQPDGQIARWAPGTGEADIIFAQTKMKQQAWEFLKWWTSERTQARFGNEIETIYGPSYRWNSSNLQAFKQLPWPSADIKAIVEQWKWLEDVPHLPGDYMVERAISNAWNNVVFNGGNPRMELEDAAIEADREIRKQLEELGYIDKSGHVLMRIRMPVFFAVAGKGK